jgi:hypothetical protein
VDESMEVEVEALSGTGCQLRESVHSQDLLASFARVSQSGKIQGEQQVHLEGADGEEGGC